MKGSGQVLAYASEDGGATFKPDFADVRDELTTVAATNTYFLLKERDSQLIYRFDCPSAYCAPTYNVTTTIPLTSVTDRNGNAIRYAYNADGTLRTITDAAGRVTSLAYDALKRCTAITLPDGKTMSYNYDEGGNLIRSTDPLGTATEYAYDPGYFLTSLTKAGRTTAIAYEDTSFGKRVSSVTDAAGYVTRYATDAVNPNLTRITDPGAG